MAEKQKIIPAEVSSSLARIRAYTNLRQAISGADLIISGTGTNYGKESSME